MELLLLSARKSDVFVRTFAVFKCELVAGDTACINAGVCIKIISPCAKFDASWRAQTCFGLGSTNQKISASDTSHRFLTS